MPQEGTFCVCLLDKSKRMNDYHSKQRGAMRKPQRVEYVVDGGDCAFSLLCEDQFQSVENGTVNIAIGGAHMRDILIDLRATCNIIDKQTWEHLKR